MKACIAAFISIIGLHGWTYGADNPWTGTWTPLPDLPLPIDNAACAVLGDSLYVVAGNSTGSQDVTRLMLVYDFKAGKWRSEEKDWVTDHWGPRMVAVSGHLEVYTAEVLQWSQSRTYDSQTTLRVYTPGDSPDTPGTWILQDIGNDIDGHTVPNGMGTTTLTGHVTLSCGGRGGPNGTNIDSCVWVHYDAISNTTEL